MHEMSFFNISEVVNALLCLTNISTLLGIVWKLSNLNVLLN